MAGRFKQDSARGTHDMHGGRWWEVPEVVPMLLRVATGVKPNQTLLIEEYVPRCQSQIGILPFSFPACPLSTAVVGPHLCLYWAPHSAINNQPACQIHFRHRKGFLSDQALTQLAALPLAS